jgi:hypothetical protein
MILKGEKGTGLNFERYLVLLQKFPERERERERGLENACLILYLILIKGLAEYHESSRREKLDPPLFPTKKSPHSPFLFLGYYSKKM